MVAQRKEKKISATMGAEEEEERGRESPKFPGFPYKPYSIQIDFMNSLYSFLDKGGVSMLESPTGTGKTLSMICSALQWVIDKREKQKSEDKDKCDKNCSNGCELDSDEPDWMRDFVAEKVPEKKVKKNQTQVGIRKKNLGKKQASCREFSNKDDTSDSCAASDNGVDLNDGEFLVEDYDSEEEESSRDGKTKRRSSKLSLSSSSDEDDISNDEDEEDEKKIKVYFCSRTHSQLSQFIKELRKTVFADELKAVCLGSRKNFCINEGVLKLGNATQINERCLELQKKKTEKVSKIKDSSAGGRTRRTKASSGCPMLGKTKLRKQFKTEISEQGAMDIEDLVRIGKSMKTCPYYGSRSMLPGADLVVLPYQSLLSKSSRESLGLSLKGNIVIIDEAHNLADSLLNMYDSKITVKQLEDVHYNIEKYFERFRNLLGPGNRRYIQTLMVLSRAFLRTLRTENESEAKSSSSSMAINDFLFNLNIDNINLIKLHHYLKESNIIHKVSGYGDKLASSQKTPGPKGAETCNEEGSTLSSFRALANMLLSLTNKDGDGRVIVSRKLPNCPEQQGGYLKYVMLTGENIFSEIVGEAHAVILAGGTLQPIEETRERLFPWLPSCQLSFFSCNHIVPPQSILPLAVTRGSSGQPFDFSFSSRSSTNMIQELGLMLCNLTTVVPEGIVVFFSSFDYEELVYNTWKSLGILERIVKKKRVFREPRKNTDIEAVLKEYKETIDALSNGSVKENLSQNGAVLLAIVGGKISEGINLSDGMGRCVVMVGLPYPSPSDIELMERVKFIEGLGNSNPNKVLDLSVNDETNSGDLKSGFDILRSCKNRGKEYYENLCMKAVNQSIGRAIRHINDYAAILLVDTRYSNSSDSSKRSFFEPTSKLPQWIKNRHVSTHNYGEVHRMLHQFFKYNKNRGF